MPRHHRSHVHAARRTRGSSLIEFTLILPLLLCMILALIEFGHLIQCRLIVSNVCREGGSLGSRTLVLDQNLANLVAVSGHPLNLNSGVGKVIITRIDAGISASQPNPRITSQVVAGSWSSGSQYSTGATNLGLPANLYAHLVYRNNPVGRGPDIAQFTTVEVFYRYVPITPLPNFIPSLIPAAGLTLDSNAIF